MTNKPLERTRGHSRCITDTQTTGLLRFLLKVLLCQGIEFSAVFFLDYTSFAVESLNVIQPVDSIRHPGVDGLEAILENDGM